MKDRVAASHIVVGLTSYTSFANIFAITSMSCRLQHFFTHLSTTLIVRDTAFLFFF